FGFSDKPDKDVYVDITVDCSKPPRQQIYAQTRNKTCDGFLDKDPEGLVCQLPSGDQSDKTRNIIWETRSGDEFRIEFNRSDDPFTSVQAQCKLATKTTLKRCKVKNSQGIKDIGLDYFKYDIVFDGCRRDPHIFLR
ncbi:MAG: hypothetical protein ACR2PZ_00310, partial [Pseudomonadales bacterium]